MISIWLALTLSPRTALAQLSGSFQVVSDDRWRGRSLSSERPAATATASFDAPNGLYVDAGATSALAHGPGLALIGAAVDAGYTKRIAQALTFDIGATRQQYTRYFSGGRPSGYTEIYAGVSGRSLNARLSYSPDYFISNFHTLYASLDAVLHLAASLQLTGHAGATGYLSPIRVSGLKTFEYDCSMGFARRFKAFDVRLNLSTGGPDRDFFGGSIHSKMTLIVGADVVF